MKPIRFTLHALDKLGMVNRWGFSINAADVEEAVRNPDEISVGYSGRRIAQSLLDDVHLLRVVYEENGEVLVITLYPARRQQYES